MISDEIMIRHDAYIRVVQISVMNPGSSALM